MRCELLDIDSIATAELEEDVLPHLVSGGGRQRLDHGIRALMLAVLEEGIQSAFSPIEQVRRDAEFWMQNRRQRPPFAFTTVCEMLGLEADAVRTAVWRLRGDRARLRRAGRRSRVRPNVRKTSVLRVRY